MLRNKNRNIWVEFIKNNDFKHCYRYFNSASMNSTVIKKLQICNFFSVTTSLNWFKESFFHFLLLFLFTKYCLSGNGYVGPSWTCYKKSMSKISKGSNLCCFSSYWAYEKLVSLRDRYVCLKKKRKRVQVALVVIQV